MINKNITFRIICIGIIFLSACSRKEFFWEGESYAKIVGPEIWTINTDSLIFSFTFYSDTVQEYTFPTEIIIMGEVADRDRQVKLAVNQNRTTAQIEDYSFETDIIIKAGEHSTVIPIIIYRSEVLKTQNKVLSIQIVETEDFKIGVNEWNSLTIIWNDMITRPTNWDNLTEFFGEYSETKYRFIISTLGIMQFSYGSDGGMTWGEMYNYKLVLIEELANYNAQNPDNPLTDENNNLVSFE